MCLPPTERVGQPKVRASGAPIPPTGALIDARSIGTVLREEEGLTVAEREVFWGKGPRAKARRALDMAEVAKHDTREDLWVCIEGRAYDLTKYAKHHPGGWQCLASLAGRDATDAFVNFHPASVYRGAAQESEIPNFKASYLGRFPLVSADFWTSDHLLERSRSVDAFSGTRARGTLTLKRR